jgi:hypothetical protein
LAFNCSARLGSSISEVLDVSAAGIQSTRRLAATLAADRFTEIRDTFRSVIATTGDEIRKNALVFRRLARRHGPFGSAGFDGAFVRWRELYKAATEQRDAARKIIDNPPARPDQERADQREREARQRDSAAIE